MTGHQCDICAAAIHGTTAAICRLCERVILADLRAVPALADELRVQIAREDRHGIRAWTSATRERPLPINLAAVEVADCLRSVLVGWTRDVCETLGEDLPTDCSDAGLARRLAAHQWPWHPGVAEFADELGHAIADARRMIDLPTERTYLGACACGEALHAWPSEALITCRCGTSWAVADRREALLAALDDQLVSATVAARALTSLDAPIGSELIRKWASRGRLEQRATIDGRPVYRLGDVRTLAETMPRGIARAGRVATKARRVGTSEGGVAN